MNSTEALSAGAARGQAPELSVVIPFFNEQDSIEPLLMEVAAALDPVCSYEIVAVDDGSTDGTPGNLRRLRSNVKNLRIVSLKHNRGQSIALANGVRAARAPLIATLDGDGQNPPGEIPTLLQAHHTAGNSTQHIIVGWRQQRGDNVLRRLSSRMANDLRRRLLHDDCPDTGCGMKVFERQLFLALPQFNHMHRFLPALFRRAGCRVINIPIAHRPRRTGYSKYGVHNRLWVGLVDLVGVYWLLRRHCPIEPGLRDD